MTRSHPSDESRVEASAPLHLTRTELFGSRWELASREPCEALRRHVRSLRGYDERAPGPRSRREFPEPWIVRIFELGESLRVTLGSDARKAPRHPGGFVAGLGDAFATTAHEGRQRGIQVDLTPTGARRVFGLPLSEIAGRLVSLRDLLPAEIDTLACRLDAAPDWASRLDLVEALLARRILGASVDTARVDWALAQIEAAEGALDVGARARELGHSRKHLVALFRDQVGIPPKLVWRGGAGSCYDRVVGAFDFGSPLDLHASMQEMHPEVDEVVFLAAGAIDVIVEEAGGERTISLEAGPAAIVPRGAWHRLVMRSSGRLVFINNRIGIQSRPCEPREGTRPT